MPPLPSSKQALHIAKESAKGTAEAAPTASIPVRSFRGKREKTKLPDMSLRGSAVDSFSEADGVFHGTFNVEGDVFADSFGHWLLSILGEEAVAGAGPYTHAFTGLNTGDQQPPGTTLWDNYSANIRRYPGAQCTALNISWEDNGLLAYSAEFLTMGDTPVAAPVSSYGTLPPYPAWAGTCLIAGVAAYPLGGNCNITRPNSEPVHVQDGSQSPRHIWVGALSVEGSINLLMENDTYYQQFVDNTQPTIDINFATGAGATATGLRLLMSKASWRTPEPDLSSSYVKLNIPYKGLGNTTDAGASGGYSPIKATLTNARSTVY